jgi:hypothetical protein
VLVRPALVSISDDPGSESKFALEDLDIVVLALLVLAGGPVVRADLDAVRHVRSEAELVEVGKVNVFGNFEVLCKLAAALLSLNTA